MSLDNFSHEELKRLSMLELASHILEDAKKAMDFQEIYDKIAEIKGFTKKAKDANISQFFTELNVDGRFMTTGSNAWGLKKWYPVDQADEEITDTPKKKKKTKKKKGFDDEDEDELDDEDEEDFELDDDEDEDEEDIVVIDKGFVEEDLDKDLDEDLDEDDDEELEGIELDEDEDEEEKDL